MAVGKPDKVIKVEYNGIEDFYEKLLRFLSPVTGLRKKERIILSYLIGRYYDLASQGLSDEELKRRLFLKEGIANIASHFKLQEDYIRVLLSTFVKNGIVIDKQINPRILMGNPIEKQLHHLSIVFENEKKGAQ